MMKFVILGMPGPWELVLIVLVLLLIFGSKKIPEIMKGFGKGIKEFKDATGKGGNTEKESKEEDKKNTGVEG
ncbi:MAG: twin-arginine translocase TatA/TatE family subunit [Bacteroidales bacterium]